MVGLGFLFAIFYWCFDAVFDVLVFQEKLFLLDFHHLFMRSTTLILFVIFGFVLEINKRKVKAQEKLKQLLQSIAIASNEARTFEEAMQVCINAVCKTTGWPLGHCYVSIKI